jgi:hypothetical protein
MAEFWTKNVEKFYFHQGHKYVHEDIYKERVKNLINSLEELQKISHDDQNFIMKMLDHRLISIFFGKKIIKQLEKHKNFKQK